MNDPFVGNLTFFRVYSGKLEAGSYVYNAAKDKRERVGRLLQMHANKREEIKEVLRRRHRRRGRPPLDHHRRHALRRGQAGHPGADGVPGAGHPRRHRAEDQGRLRQDGPGPQPARRWRTPRSGSAPTRRPARPSSPAWASSTWRSSSTACSASSRSRRTWASPRSPTARPSPRRSRPRASTSGRPAARASTATAGSGCIPQRAGQGLRVRERHRGRRHPQGVHHARSRRASRRP